MKLSSFLHLFESLVKEGVMDNETTQLSRLIVNHLKHYAKASLTGAIPNFNSSIGDIQVIVSFEKGNDLKTRGGTFTQDPKDESGVGITVYVQVPWKFKESDLNQFIPDLKEVLRHELEHLRQSIRRNKAPMIKKLGVHGSEIWHAIYGEYPKSNSQLDSLESYYLHPVEIEAYVMGAYKYAKSAKIPFVKALARSLEKISDRFPDKFSSERKELLTLLRVAWVEYLEKRFPGVNISVEQIPLPKKISDSSRQTNLDTIDSTGEIVTEKKK